MPKKALKHRDAALTLQIYDLRREKVMRESREAMRTFVPTSLADIEALLKPSHPLNAAYRQVATFWEMIYSFARNDIMDADFLAENNGEGLLLLAKVYPYLEDIRAKSTPLAFRNAEWLIGHSPEAKKRFGIMQQRVEKMIAEKSGA